MRRFLLLGALLFPMLAPGSALAGTCPALAGGVVDRDAYRLGELVDFYGTYHDFADPGTVTIEFKRTTDGATRSFTASNSADGSWYLRLTFDSVADIGRWNVAVVVSQTDGLDSCTDRVTIRGRSSVPDTATTEETLEPADTTGTIMLTIVGLVAALLAFRRSAAAHG
jgi:hypothetical protein